jgi:hypothetical protein
MNQTFFSREICSPQGRNKWLGVGTYKLLKLLVCSYCSYCSRIFGQNYSEFLKTQTARMFPGLVESYYYLYIVGTVGTVGTTQEQQGFPRSYFVPTVPMVERRVKNAVA